MAAMAFCLSLSAALARSAQTALVTPTAAPPLAAAAYMPLIIRAGQPPAATATAPASAIATSTAAPSSTVAPSSTATTTATATATATATSTATATATATNTATAAATATAAPSGTATATATASTTATPTGSPTATATVAPGAGNCLDNVFPIALDRLALENNQPSWYKPMPLANPYAENAQIPGLNTTNANSPRFRVYNPSNNGGWFFWTRWNGNQSSWSSADFTAALTGRGTLSNGFSEASPLPFDPAALPLVNGILEAGDWLPHGYGFFSNDIKNALDSHIANKDLMVLPVYDKVQATGDSSGGFHVVRFVQVRLLDYNLSGSNPYFEFALIEDNKQCFGTLRLNEKLEWYELGPAHNYDIVIVQDYSYSMRFCWDTTAVCPLGTRRIDHAAAGLRDFVNQMLVVGNQQQGADHRLAYVTFSQNSLKRIGFNSDTDAALAQFKAAIGDVSSPRTIPNSDLSANTNIASGLTSAVSYLNGARTVDKNGKPVKLVVLLLTDGVANVFSDGPGAGVTNSYQNA
ncbi:MAG TPA: vWA domain-containing protein, partial [Herpetosiphonaceae bacterium]|nr:vWA domain-containing protein [Herpetosiphonaceae bacterium]